MNDIREIWIPEPINAAKTFFRRGGRKTSPCTLEEQNRLFTNRNNLDHLQLPACFFCHIILEDTTRVVDVSHEGMRETHGVLFIVAGNVTTKRSNDDHRENTSEKEDNNHGVDDWKPMDLNITHRQVRVPSVKKRRWNSMEGDAWPHVPTRPSSLTWCPFHFVGHSDFIFVWKDKSCVAAVWMWPRLPFGSIFCMSLPFWIEHEPSGAEAIRLESMLFGSTSKPTTR